MSASEPPQGGLAAFVRRRLARGAPYGLGATLAVVAVIAGLWGFLAIVDSVTEADALARFDARAHEVVYQAVGPQNVDAVRGVTWLANNATLIAFVVLGMLALGLSRRYWSAFRLGVASGVGGLIVTGLKILFQRGRPLEQVIPAHGYSLPSGHAFAATVFYGFLIYLVFRFTDRVGLRVLAAAVGLAVILAVGLSRVYLNVHYLTDVVAGWTAGATWLVASQLVISGVERRTRSRAERAEEVARPSDDATPE